MTATLERLARPSTEAEAERRTGFLELFFDLVFVFAVTQVTALVLADPTAAGFARAALLLGLVWWAWSGYAWMTNAIDVESTLVRLLFLGAALGSFFVALAIPEAFGADAAWFAVAYFAIRVLHVALYVWGLRLDPEHQRAVKQLAPWFLVAPAVVLVGGFVESEALRTALWTASIVIDVSGALNVSRAPFRVSPGHFAERYGLFMIIALGESIVAIGVGAAEAERDARFGVAVAIAFAGVAALWWAYFDFTAQAAERALRFAPPDRRAPLARDLFSLLHFAPVLGIILYAVAAEKTLAHPDEALSGAGRTALALGIGLYLAGLAAARFRVVRRIAWERLGGAAAVAVAVLVLGDLDAAWLLAVAVALLVAAIALEAVRLREVRAQVRADGPPVSAS